MSSATFLTQHLIGLKNANDGVSLFWYFNEFVGGGSLMCSILAAHLERIPNLKKKTVFLQLDNCSDNKNWVIIKFCKLLVGLGKVQSFFVNFLPVGHTHVDIDQV